MRSPIKTCAYTVVLVALLVVPGRSLAAADADARELMARRLQGAANQLVFGNEPTMEMIELAQLLCHEATDLAPNDEHAWRTLLDLAELAEDEQSQQRALDRLVELAPDDEVLRLKYVDRQINQFQTVEERVEAYLDALDSSGREALGPAVASRLAMDLALLQRRRGDNEAFARWLAEAVALDPANRAAVATAAGYFRMNVSDAFAEAELLVAMFLADPVSITAQSTLATHLLDQGAYESATRICSIIVATYQAQRAAAPNEIIADLAIAQWGNDDADAAMETIQQRQMLVDTFHRRQLRRDEPELSSLERARQQGVISPTLATLRAAIDSMRNSDRVSRSVNRLVQAYDRVLENELAEESPDQPWIAQMRLDLAWVLLLLDDADHDRIDSLINEVTAEQSLSEQAQARMAGWQALRSGAPEEAMQIFEPVIEDDAAAKLGYATALLNTGQRRDAARHLLTLARDRAGTLIGVWSAHSLWDVLGQRVSLGGETVRDIERLVASLPRAVDRFPTDPTTAVSIRVVPAATTLQPFEPVIVDLELTNNSRLPLAISREGPIRPQVALVVTASVPGARLGRIPTIVVNVDRRLRLEPRERVVIPIDLRSTVVGSVLDAYAVQGATLDVKAVLNFTVSQQGAILPGLLGSERDAPLFRINGARATGDWLENTVSELLNAEDEDLGKVGMLAQVVGRSVGDNAPQQIQQLLADGREALVEVYSNLSAPAQAWVLSVMPRSDSLEVVREQARSSDSRAVQLAYLMYHVHRPNDPMLDTAARSGDSRLERIAELLTDLLDDTDDLFDQPVEQMQQPVDRSAPVPPEKP